MNYDLKKDLSTLSSLTLTDISRLTTLCSDIICNNVNEDTDDITSVDIGIGTLHIQRTTTSIKYKFVPSRDLEKSLVETTKDPLICKLESSLTQLVVHSYKDLI